MTRLKMLIVLGLWIGVTCVESPLTFAQGQPSFTIFIPQKVPPSFVPAPPNFFPPIGAVRARFSVVSNASVIFTITDVTGAPQAFKAVTPSSSGPQTLFFPSGDTVNGDQITLWPIPDPSDPNRYEMEFLLRRDSNANSTPPCQGTQGKLINTYRVDVTSGPLITGVCLESRDGHPRPTFTSNSCTSPSLDAIPIPVPLDDPSDMVATLNSPPATNQPTAKDGCFSQRSPVDVVLVLDKSGSMATRDNPGVTPTRMDALHTAATNFVNMWGSLPPATGSAGPDSIGVVVFDTSSPLSPLVPLTDVTNPANRTSVISAVNAVMPGGSTSIGAGLQRADAMLAPVAGRRKVALLMSDGQQNTDPWVDASTGLVATFCLFDPVPCLGGIGIVPTSKVPLTNQPRIYTVTLGPTVSAAINQDIAIKSKGFYLNTEEPGGANLLSPFFLELLQNFLRFNSYETVRMISETTSYSAKIPISTTSLNAAFSLMWPSRLGPLRLTITPPGGAQPIVQENALGFISVVQSLPLPAPFDPTGDWKVQVEAVNPGAPTALAKTGTQGSIPFDLHLMTDDTGIKTDLAIVPGDYKPGSEIKLRAKLTRFGLPILGLGSHPGDRIEVELIRPGESIGDMLSDSTASAVPSCPPSGPCDRQSPAEAKLANTLAQDPSKLKRVKAPSVALYDDGKPEHGDDVAGDGIYNALYTADMPGHYNFLFAAESTDPNTVRFSRQQLRTAYVRAVPDSDKTKTTFQTSIQPCLLRTAPVAGPGTTTNTSGSACNTLVITMKPRTKFGNRMGPGWANYFWFTSPGVASANAIRATDNPKLDGTYTATLNFTGNKPPDVFLHFEDVIAVIGDSVTQDQLPQKLDGGNALTKVPPPSSGNWAAFLDLGAGFPIGTFSSAFNTGFSLNAGLEYIINPHISAEGIFGYHHFPAKVGLNLNVYQFSANAKFYLTAPPNKWRPFLNFGPGAYKFSLGSSNIGGNFGAGILREFAQPLGGRFGLQGSYNFHITNSSGGATKFSTLQGGIRYVF